MTPPSPLQLCELSDKKVAIEYERFKQAKRELYANPSGIGRQRIKFNVWLVAPQASKVGWIPAYAEDYCVAI